MRVQNADWSDAKIVRVSHTKASVIGPSIQIPITKGRLNLGTWQGRRDDCEEMKLMKNRNIFDGVPRE